MRRKQVVVIGSSESTPQEERAAYLIGQAVAESGFVLITGGRTGVMDAASRGAKEHGGCVVAILPSGRFEEANPYCDIVIPTGIGYARNSINVLAGDLIISIGGSAGTLAELAYAWQYRKKIVACSYTGGWSAKLAASAIDARRSDVIIEAASHEDIIKQLEILKKEKS